MAKLESAQEFNALVDEGKYESKVNAQRAAGRTRLSESEKKKCFMHIEKHFPPDGIDKPPLKRPAKKAARAGKKLQRVGKKVTPTIEALKAVPLPKPTTPTPKKVVPKKKVATHRRLENEASLGTLPLSPSGVQTVADILVVIDSTVSQGERILGALERAHKIHDGVDIHAGVDHVRSALTNAAQLLNQSVVDQLMNAGPQSDPNVAARLAAVIDAAPSITQHVPPQNMASHVAPVANGDHFGMAAVG